MGDGERTHMTQIRNSYKFWSENMRKGTSLNNEA